MKSLWATAPFRFELREVDVPQPSACEVLVKVQACGICGTDIRLAQSGAATPVPLGHEVAGVIADVGSAARRFKPGDRVIVENASACGQCRLCRMGQPAHCQHLRTYCNDQAGLGEYLCVDESTVQPCEGLDPLEATLCEPLTVAIDVTSVADIPMEADVAVFGCGTIGLMCVALARRMRGANTVLFTGTTRRTERGARRLQCGTVLGADVTVASCEEDLQGAIKNIAPEGLDRVIITAPPQTLVDAVRASRFGGIISLIGIEYGEGGTVTWDVNEFHFKKLQLRASHNIPNHHFPLAVDLLRRRVIDPAHLITHVFPLAEYEEAFRTATDPNQPAVKVVVEC